MSRDHFGEVFQSHFRTTIRFLTSFGAKRETAEEIAQAAWVKGWEHRQELRNPNSLATWVNSIASNMLKGTYRERAHMHELTFSEGTSEVDLSSIVARDVLGKCRECDRALLRRHYIEGYTTEEIAKESGLSPVAIRVRLSRLRKALQGVFRFHSH